MQASKRRTIYIYRLRVVQRVYLSKQITEGEVPPSTEGIPSGRHPRQDRFRGGIQESCEPSHFLAIMKASVALSVE